MPSEAGAPEPDRAPRANAAEGSIAAIRRTVMSWVSRAKGSPVDAAIALLAVAFGAVAIAWPFFAARYPAMTDLPFHAAMTSAFRHWFDPAYHFRDQFELHPLSVPYDSSYVLGALLMLVMPAVPAVKIATAIMLSALPIGLGTLAWGMRKSPLLGVAALPFVWCDLTHWGFINFVSALGMFAMAVGLALRTVDRPSRRTQWALSICLVVLLFTHVFRFPFAIAGVVGAGVVVYPVTRRFRPLLAPLVPPLVLFAAFWLTRSETLGGGAMGPLTLHPERWAEIPTTVVNGFHDPRELASATGYLRILGAVALLSLALGLRPWLAESRRDRLWTVLATLVPLSCAAVFLLLFFVLPMEIGLWWYVYPREATAALFVALACLPDLPRAHVAKIAAVCALGAASLRVTHVVADNYAEFDRATEDFTKVEARIGPAPRLLYLIFDHAGTHRTNTPFIHLPAWVQADKGGWLSFHFAVWGATPLRYREDPGAIVPPPVPLRWEWTPEKFNVTKNGAFFDWFLVRSTTSADPLFNADPSIVRVTHEGTWWLYHREGVAPRP